MLPTIWAYDFLLVSHSTELTLLQSHPSPHPYIFTNLKAHPEPRSLPESQHQDQIPLGERTGQLNSAQAAASHQHVLPPSTQPTPFYATLLPYQMTPPFKVPQTEVTQTS